MDGDALIARLLSLLQLQFYVSRYGSALPDTLTDVNRPAADMVFVYITEISTNSNRPHPPNLVVMSS